MNGLREFARRGQAAQAAVDEIVSQTRPRWPAVEEEHYVVFDEEAGTAWTFYDDDLSPVLEAVGPIAALKRAGHVDPKWDGMWRVRLAKWVPGRRYYGPFKSKREAVAAEVRALRRRL